MTEIPASIGNPYRLSATNSGLIKLARNAGERPVFMLFSASDALAVADALVDFVEAMNN